MAENLSSKRTKVTLASGTTSSELSPAAETIANNVDLLTEILLRLPPRSLLRFRCVSKHWLSLISNPQFALNHSRQNPRPSISGLYYYKYYYNTGCGGEIANPVSFDGPTTRLPTLAFLEPAAAAGTKPRIKHSCNGLILCSTGIKTYYVCNLTTQKYAALPKTPGVADLAYLAFDPSKSPHYKVVTVRMDVPFFDIYSSESASWKVIMVGPFCVGGVYCNGAIHWLADEGLGRFDVDSEEVIAMPHPPSPKILPKSKIRYFGECGGNLLLVQSHVLYSMECTILTMERDYSRWVVRCQVNLEPLISEFLEVKSITRGCRFRMLSVGKGTSETDFMLVLVIACKVISYDLKCKTMKVLGDCKLSDWPPEDYYLSNYVVNNSYQFIESLFPA